MYNIFIVGNVSKYTTTNRITFDDEQIYIQKTTETIRNTNIELSREKSNFGTKRTFFESGFFDHEE